jgi:hypothetical protein
MFRSKTTKSLQGANEKKTVLQNIVENYSKHFILINGIHIL